MSTTKQQIAFVAYQDGLLMPFTMRCRRKDVEHYLVHEHFTEPKSWGLLFSEGWRIKRVTVRPIEGNEKP